MILGEVIFPLQMTFNQNFGDISFILNIYCALAMDVNYVTIVIRTVY